jgi:predicted nucleotidyltransferase
MSIEELLNLLRALGEQSVEYVLIGGAAMNIHGVVRATEDVDLFVRPDAKNIENVRTALRSIWDDDEIELITADDLSGAYPVVRYGPPQGNIAIDLLASLGNSYTYDDISSEIVTIEGIQIRIATPQMLYRMKRNTVRPIDRSDAEALRSIFGFEELDDGC